ncbi:MAG: phosphatase PAP2 family protein [Thiotrichales bacterium]
MESPHAARAFNFRLGFGLPLVAMGLLLVLDPTALDFAIARLFYVPGEGFVGRYDFWLENILHDYARKVVVLFGVFCIAAFVTSLVMPRWRHWRRRLAYVVLALSLSTGVVGPLKTLSNVQCPWNLQEFGGSERYSSLLDERPPASRPGRCWPGGHASAAFSLLAVFFMLRDRHPREARIALGVALGLGTLFSLGRLIQGAHFLSHNLWTLLLDWMLCLFCYRMLLFRHPVSAVREGP